jgi:hypothetical protein
LIARLGAAPDRLLDARRIGVEVDARGNRVPARPDGWTASAHVAHLLEFEEDAILPRVSAYLTTEEPSLDEWEPTPLPRHWDLAFDEVVARFAFARRRTVELLESADPDHFAIVAHLGKESPTLYQFLRGISQHDGAHALRIRERVHPDLLRVRDSGVS